jgi:acyl-CoA thioester hydrolase
MARTKLTEQETYEFQCSLHVRPQDINYSGHVGNDSLISLVGAARAIALHSMDLSELDLGDGRTGIIMADLQVSYRGEAFLFDELHVDSHFGEIGRSSFRIFHRVRKGDKLIALVETSFAAYDYPARKIAPVPGRFLDALGKA